MPGHLVSVALATVAAAVPAHFTGAHIPRERHVAAGSSFAPAPALPQGPARTAHHAPTRRPRVRQDLHLATTRPRTAARHRPVAHQAAGDPGVTIADFHFTAPSTTVHVGDTITWTNDGPSAHTATASNGSFDTGTLNKGQSASHTFTQTGTFTYICRIHPFMHGTIVVLAAAASTTSPTTTAPSSVATPPTTTSAATTATTAQASAPAPSLPNTGLDVISAIAAGGILVSAGLALRRAVRP
jgi:plastocyanin